MNWVEEMLIDKEIMEMNEEIIKKIVFVLTHPLLKTLLIYEICMIYDSYQRRKNPFNVQKEKRITRIKKAKIT